MNISESLSRFLDLHLADASRQLLSELGYRSDRTVDLPSSNPNDFLSIITQMVPGATFDRAKALFDEWSSADLLFQVTDEDLSGQNTLFKETSVAPGLLRSYLFFAVELTGGDYSRTKLTGIVRQLNRLFPMPVMVLIKHREKGIPVLSIAVINRAQNKRDASKDVLGKVTIIRGIALENTHRGHLDILDSLRVENLKHPQRLPVNNFDALHVAWEEIFNVELLNQRFYRELSNWFFWALPKVDFPADDDSDSERRRATSLIRLLTRLIFCWFLKEKQLIPEDIFVEAELKKILKDLDDDSSSFHEAILQNLFFATLNQRMGINPEGQPYRSFAKDEGFQKNKGTYGVDTLLRYEDHFKDPDEILKRLADVPFLNGGLFECLDRTEEETGKKTYVDGFSRNHKKRPILPNRLFFSSEHKVDLSDAYGEPKRKNEKVRGLIRLLNSYKFTIVENTPIDQEIALDPELLGKVFENLLATYNSETRTTARKQTGSFYTPRPIVDYIVDESLKSYLSQVLIQHGSSEDQAKDALTNLLGYGEEAHPFTAREQDLLLDAIHKCKILDPACGSGAFPMGMLHKLVHVIHKLDPTNSWWKQKHLSIAELNLDPRIREAAIKQVLEIFEENDPDYGRKLYLIENCLYGADIQPIAIQITNLRFFISLIIDQRENKAKENRGIRPLPNLETKFVAANTLLALDFDSRSQKDIQDDTERLGKLYDQLGTVQYFERPPIQEAIKTLQNKVSITIAFEDPEVKEIERKLASLFHQHFKVLSRPEKLRIQREIKASRKRLAQVLETSLGEASAHIAGWDPFDHQQRASFFDPHWMFGATLADGFDIVFGNPPYVQIQKLPEKVDPKEPWRASKESLRSFPVKKTKSKTEIRPRFETFNPLGDIYCLFYERGAQLLKPGGTLSYITSNKWMRTGYGESLRRYLAEKVDTLAVLDFGMAQNFGAATTYTCITTLVNRRAVGKIESCYAVDDREAMANPGVYFEANKVTLKVGPEPWVILSPARQRIKELVESKGIPLEKWDIRISRGIITGLNDAFYLTKSRVSELQSEDPSSIKLIVKLLQGKDIVRYGANWSDLYQLIVKFGAHEFLGSEFKAVFRHLQKFEQKLKERGQCRYSRSSSQAVGKSYPGQHHWLELDNNPQDDYIAEFSKPKIIYASMTKYLPFYFDPIGEFFVNDKGFIITSVVESLEYLVAVLNSSTFRTCFRDNFPELQGNTYEVRKIFVDKIPIRKPEVGDAELFAPLVRLVQLARKKGDEMRATFLEDLIDACVMESYFLDHMADRDLLFHEQLRPLLEGHDTNAGQESQLEFLHRFYETVNAPAHPVRNQLIRLTADSPDLLAVIKREGAV